ncbi:hypothetical protein [Tahibacter caeni]|uniref:hypothetical protein n=1 Tax=Tahibacter caeni TaxID=1453545 RepID=UPI002148ECD5|nr:hypothetical protein [Tahibacter caeni]
MRRHRLLVVWLCLIALVACQSAMAAQLCHGFAGTKAVAEAGCHGMPADGGGDAGSADCPGGTATPDLGKLPGIAPLPFGHDFITAIAPLARTPAPAAPLACSRDGPDLDRLCRLLI